MASSQPWVKMGLGLLGSFVVAVAYTMARKGGSEDDQMTTGTGQFDLSVDSETGELIKCPKKKLIAILEDLQMEYTPYYTHYYHSLTAL